MHTMVSLVSSHFSLALTLSRFLSLYLTQTHTEIFEVFSDLLSGRPIPCLDALSRKQRWGRKSCLVKFLENPSAGLEQGKRNAGA